MKNLSVKCAATHHAVKSKEIIRLFFWIKKDAIVYLGNDLSACFVVKVLLLIVCRQATLFLSGGTAITTIPPCPPRLPMRAEAPQRCNATARVCGGASAVKPPIESLRFDAPSKRPKDQWQEPKRAAPAASARRLPPQRSAKESRQQQQHRVATRLQPALSSPRSLCAWPFAGNVKPCSSAATRQTLLFTAVLDKVRGRQVMGSARSPCAGSKSMVRDEVSTRVPEVGGESASRPS